jgi:arylsulfatase A-like enzyme
MGNTILKTPHIDKIAERGRRFENFYVSIPICMPNRATLFTGRMPSLHGAHCNGAPLSLSSNTMTEMMRRAGYHTELVGKSHLQNMTGRAAMMPRPSSDGLVQPDAEAAEARLGMWSDGDYEQENTRLWAENPAHQPTLPYYGFNKIDLSTMHGDVVGGSWRRWAKSQNPDVENLIGPENATPDPRYVTPQAYRTRIPEALYPTNYVVDRTLQSLDEVHADPNTPFFLVASFPDPHHPFTPPGKYWDMYDPDDIPTPASLQPNAQAATPALEHIWRARSEGTADTQGTLPYAVNDREARESIALTYGMISMIDDGVGRIMQRLDDLNLAEDTIVIFMSDHGDFMGDHGLMLKAALHYQGLIRVPFIWSEAGMPNAGNSTSALHSTVDIARTILSRAGIAHFWGLQGTDMAASLNDPLQDGADAVLIEEDGHEPAMGFEQPVRVRSVVTKRYRLSIYDGVAWGELYDLREDPHEMRNLYDDPAYAGVRGEMFECLARQMMTHADHSPFPTGRA